MKPVAEWKMNRANGRMDPIWPELPSSKIPNLTCDWVWSAFDPSSIVGLRDTLARHGGKTYSHPFGRCPP